MVSSFPARSFLLLATCAALTTGCGQGLVVEKPLRYVDGSIGASSHF